MRDHIDINCDMGEGMGNEEALMPFISSANIACGYHAGDTNSILHTLELCKQFNVTPGHTLPSWTGLILAAGKWNYRLRNCMNSLSSNC